VNGEYSSEVKILVNNMFRMFDKNCTMQVNRDDVRKFFVETDALDEGSDEVFTGATHSEVAAEVLKEFDGYVGSKGETIRTKQEFLLMWQARSNSPDDNYKTVESYINALAKKLGYM